MKGSYFFKVRSKKVLFEFRIRRNITIIKGESATGKTTLLHMLYEYLRVGKESGYSVSTDASYFVYLRPEVGRDWKSALLSLKNTIIFIEENNNFIFHKEFAEFVKKSGNYFVIVNRSPLKMFPYSIHEIYEIITEKKHADIKESYHAFKELYSNYPMIKLDHMQNIVTEDSNAGYQFFREVYAKQSVYSASGNSNIIHAVQKTETGDVLVIADGAAFGAVIEDCLEYFSTKERRRVTMWLPESFEYLILNSGLVSSGRLKTILGSPSDYIDCGIYASWEQYFTELLSALTADTEHPYSKERLHEYYLQSRNKEKILEQFPEEIYP